MHAHQMEEQAHETLPPDIADRLLELLSTSDVFRAKFQRDPAGALHDVGHEPAAAMRGKRPFKGQPYYCLTRKGWRRRRRFGRHGRRCSIT